MSTLLTFQDLVDALTDYSGANPNAAWNRNTTRALILALDELSQSHHWSYLYQHRFITTTEPQTILEWEYVHGGGTYPRVVTLTGAETWPDWVRDGILRIGTVNYDVAEQKSATEITLDVNSNPGEDLTQADVGSATLYRDAYVLPTDCWTIDEIYPEDLGPSACVDYVHPREWLSRTRYSSSSSNYPSRYTIMGSADYQGAMELRLFPYPDSQTTLAFIYSRRPRPVVIKNEHTGLASAGVGSSYVSGTDTSFNANMIGSVIRLSANASEEPTGREVANPAAYERVIINVTDAVTLQVDESFAADSIGVKYVISDPVDIDVPLMHRALLRCAENQMGKLLRLEDRTALDAEWMQALKLAREADSRSTQMRAVGTVRYRQRLADMAGAADEE